MKQITTKYHLKTIDTRSSKFVTEKIDQLKEYIDKLPENKDNVYYVTIVTMENVSLEEFDKKWAQSF